MKHFAILLITGLTRLISGATARWINQTPPLNQTIYFANHSSHLDAVVLWSALPENLRKKTRPVAAKDYWDKTRLRRYLAKHVFNAVLIDRAPNQALPPENNTHSAAVHTIDALIQAMGSHFSLIIFPEGTRGSGEQIADFKSGLYYLAKQRPDVELIPVFMENLSRILPKGEALPVPLLSSVSFGPAIQLKADETKAEFLQRARQAIEILKKA